MTFLDDLPQSAQAEQPAFMASSRTSTASAMRD